MTTTSHEFQYTLYRTRGEMLSAIAYEWWTAGGANTPEQIDAMPPMTAEAAARECISGFGLDEPGQYDDEPSHMDAHGYSVEDLAAAMQDFMDERPDRRAMDDDL